MNVENVIVLQPLRALHASAPQRKTSVCQMTVCCVVDKEHASATSATATKTLSEKNAQ